ncbi:MAG: carotenoid 1,2-hydratase [Chloroflexi bacterium]|nr:carotenoid 1,2-hydratase [Chloroflexota bacterium]
MWRVLLLALCAVAIALLGFSLIDSNGGGEVGATALLVDVNTDSSGFARALAPWEWQFPRDHGPHPAFQTEWWYYTGNVATADGRRFGYQFTVFRRAISPTAARSESEWRSDQIYMAHFTVSDISGQRFYHDERYSRGAAELAGASSDPVYRVWLEDWQVIALNADATQTQISADAGTFAVTMTLQQVKPPALQGDNGLSAKSATPGNASYYYSLSRLVTEGSMRIGGESFAVSGYTWMDHEFSTSALGSDALGWDWFGLIFDNNTELMVGQIRLVDGEREPYFGGLYVREDGSTVYLDAADFTITALDTWTSPHTAAVYPSGWEIVVTLPDSAPLRLTLTPLLRDQELHNGAIAYWEGAVQIGGDLSGYGYAELTGYADTMTGRF